jgi:LmeA-like phospholipid-binding
MIMLREDHLPMRRFLICIVVLLVLLVGIDRVGALVASRELADKVQQSQGLATRPHVKIHGFPFLTQVVRGSYSHISLSATSPVTTNGVELDDAKAQLYGVQVSTSEAFHGTVSSVPVKRGVGSALVSYDSIDAALRHYAGPVGGLIKVTESGPGKATLHGPLGISLSLEAEVHNGKLTLLPAPGALDALPNLIADPLTKALTTPIPLPTFPFNISLTDAKITPAGIALSATTHNAVFPVHQ